MATKTQVFQLDLKGSGKKSKKNWCREWSSIVASIKGLNKPHNTALFFGQLIAHAIRQAERNNLYKTTVFKNFIAALRDYIKHTNSNQCSLICFDAAQNWVISTGKGAGTRNFFLEAIAHKDYRC